MKKRLAKAGRFFVEKHFFASTRKIILIKFCRYDKIFLS